MNKLSIANHGSGERHGIRSAAVVIGMAALWIAVFKQLLYPVLYAYYRTGDESALLAQGVFSVALVAVSFCLLIAHAKLDKLLGKGRWIVMALGIGGAIGIALRVFPDPTTESGEAMICAGALLSAAYVPVHLAFWALYARRSNGAIGTHVIAASFALFLAAYGILALTGADSVYVSIACPVVSAAMALACPSPEERRPQSANPATMNGATESVAVSEPAAANVLPADDPLAAPSATNAPSAASTPSADPQPEPTSPPASHVITQLPKRFTEEFGLSEREAELAAYAHRNWSARRIAGELFIAESTVYTHLKRIYRKTGVHSKHELIDLIDSWHSKD